MNEIDQRTIEVVCRVLGIDISTVDSLMPRNAISQWDSLKHIQVILALEDEFAVEFSDLEITSFGSIHELIDLIASKVRT